MAELAMNAYMKPMFVEMLCTFPKTSFKKMMYVDVSKVKIFCPTGENGSKTMIYFGPDDYVVAEINVQEFKEKLRDHGIC